ncbi:hypothetical protein CIRG_08853 [Coccidioides immitis RMSCC 2394]|uniref:Uncharacterized protein n=1 Tax=Coccidioides immitis RMSCC 2394 TaxID=404692 RepID=A0A0J7BG17_COCIT|nr:hypothetical protein CIRG_08853 [Coccidioides immitis RMSCC 2394]
MLVTVRSDGSAEEAKHWMGVQNRTGLDDHPDGQCFNKRCMKLGGRAGVVSGHAGRREDAEPPRPPPRQTKGDASSWIPYSWAGRERERGCESTAGEETMTGESELRV